MKKAGIYAKVMDLAYGAELPAHINLHINMYHLTIHIKFKDIARKDQLIFMKFRGKTVPSMSVNIQYLLDDSVIPSLG